MDSFFEIHFFQDRLMYVRFGRLVLLGSYPYSMKQYAVITGAVGSRRWAWRKVWRFAWISGNGLETI